jgi:hypothetical protein
LLSCGGSSKSSVSDYFPTATGASWTFEVTPPSGGAPYTATIQITQGSPSGATEKTTTTSLPGQYTVNTVEIDGAGVSNSRAIVYRVSDDSQISGDTYAPPGLILPSDTAA